MRSALTCRMLLFSLALSSCFPAHAQQKALKDSLGIAVSDHRQTYMFFPMNIVYRISKKLDQGAEQPGFLYDPNSTETKLRKLLGDKPIVCKMVIEPSTGKVSSVSINESSGSQVIDEKALDLITSAGPYCSDNSIANEKTFYVHFPVLQVK